MSLKTQKYKNPIKKIKLNEVSNLPPGISLWMEATDLVFHYLTFMSTLDDINRRCINLK